jgi:hypothetical protein
MRLTIRENVLTRRPLSEKGIPILRNTAQCYRELSTTAIPYRKSSDVRVS